MTRAGWKFSKHEERINSDPFVDDFPTLPACSRDDQYSFRKDNTYEINEGATTCNPGDPQVFYTGTWSFVGNGNQINIDGSISAIDNWTRIHLLYQAVISPTPIPIITSMRLFIERRLISDKYPK